jgi:F-type H+-transporting ATPase subunit epsilon
MYVSILTPDSHVFEGDAEVVTLPGTDGLYQVLDSHAPMITTLAKGTIVVKTKGVESRFETNGGVAEILGNRLSILAEGVLI